MAKNVNFPNTLVSNSADNPTIAHTDNIYDKVQKKMQEFLNKRLADFFVFENEGEMWAGKLDGSALKDGTVDVSKLKVNYNFQVFMNEYIDQRIASVVRKTLDNEGLIADLTTRLEALESAWQTSANSLLGRTAEDGFFVVDDEWNVGACIIPTGEGEYASYGWDGNPVDVGTVTEYTSVAGGVYIVVHEADFSNSNLPSLLPSSSISDITLGVPTIANNVVTVTATPTPSDYQGGYRWWVGSENGGQSYLRVQANQTGATAHFDITEIANHNQVTIYCQPAANYNVTKYVSVNVSYSQPYIALNSVTIDSYTTNAQSNPIVAPTFNLHAAPSPTNASVASYQWSVGGTQTGVVSIASGTSTQQTCTFNVAQGITTPTMIVVTCTATDVNGVSKSYQRDFWVQYSASATSNWTLSGIHPNNSTSITARNTQVAIEGDYVDYTTNAATTAPVENVMYELVSGTDANVSSAGVLTLGENSVAGEDIFVKASVANPNYNANVSGVNTTDPYFDTLVGFRNDYTPVMTGIMIDSDNVSKLTGTRYKFDYIVLPQGAPDVQVKWTLPKTPSRVATIDQNTGVLYFNSNLEQVNVPIAIDVKVETVGTSVIYEDTVTVSLVYDDSGDQVARNVFLLSNPGGEYVDFYAYMKPIDTPTAAVDTTPNADGYFVEWSVVQTYTAKQIDDAIQASSQTPSITKAMIVPVNGTSDSTLVVESESAIMDTKLYALTPVEINTIGLQDADSHNMYWGQSVNVPIIRGIRSRGVTRLVTSELTEPAFGDGTTMYTVEGAQESIVNRLYLANYSADDEGYIADNLVEGYIVRCTLKRTVNNETTELCHKDCYYETTYKKGVLPVGSIGLRAVSGEHITIDPSTATPIIYVNVPDVKNYDVLQYVYPIATNNHEETDYNFDASKVGFAHLTGEYHSNISTLMPQGLVHGQWGASGEETWEISYAWNGASRDATRLYYYWANRQVSDITYPKNRVFVQARAAIAGPEKVVETTTDIKVYYNGADLSGATITAAVAGVPIDGGQLSVVNQNGNIIYDTNGHVVTGAYAVTSGGEYFSINSLGRNMIIKNTGGVSKQVTIKVTALNKTKEINFAVKAGG